MSGRPGVVDLHDEAGVGDGFVFRPHHLSNGVDEFLLRLVVVVVETVVDGAGSEGGNEGLRVGDALQGGLEVGHVRVDDVVAYVGKGAGADLSLPGLVGTANQSQAKAHFLGVELPKVRAVAAVLAHGRDLARAGFLHLKAADALVQVEVEARLGLLAVTDDVDAVRHLLVHDLLDGGLDPRGEDVGVVGLAVDLGVEHRPQIRGTRQAARVGGEYVVFTALHGCDSPPMCR